jgi:5-methylcytosine-specific restriction enzyme A
VTSHAVRRYCPVQNCPNRTNGGLCPEHANKKQHARFNYTWQRLYRRTAWKRLRERVLFEEPICGDCKRDGRITASQDVHHLKRPTNETQFYERANLQALCRPCHSTRTGLGE